MAAGAKKLWYGAETWYKSTTDKKVSYTDTDLIAQWASLKSSGVLPWQKPQPAVSVVIDGVTVNASELVTAITCLKAAKGGQVIAPLKTIGHKLAGVDHYAVARIEMDADPTLRKGQYKTKTAFLRHLAKQLDLVKPVGFKSQMPAQQKTGSANVTFDALLGQGTSAPDSSKAAKQYFTFDGNGYAQPFGSDYTVPAFHEQMASRMAAIAAVFGAEKGGNIVARGAEHMEKFIRRKWLEAWYRGDMTYCYQLETTCVGTEEPRHPGHPDNTWTHTIVWQPAVAGELPAGVIPPGSWTDLNTTPLLQEEVDNYLLATQMAHPTHLTDQRRRLWVIGHRKGNKPFVDSWSLHAKNAHDKGHTPCSQPPVYTDLSVAVSSQTFDLSTPPETWPISALAAYAQQEHLTEGWMSCCAAGKCGNDALKEAVMRHVAQVAADKKAAEDAILIFSYAPDQPKLSGFHRKLVLVDQHGSRWVFKPAPDDTKHFRPETEHSAHQLARLWGYRTAESQLIEFDGMYGQAQRMFTETGNFAACTGADFAAYTLAQLTALACEHLLDWALDNDDAKGDNIIITDDTFVVGVDKARAWIYFGGWDGLSSHDSANSNAPLVYTELYRAIKHHHLTQDTVDAIFRAVVAKARRMQRLSDVTLARIITTAVANRPHYKPPIYRAPFAGAPSNADELITAATARKNALVDDMTALWQRVYDGAGWQLPDLSQSALGDNAQGHPMHAGLHAPALHEAVTESKSYGTPTFVAGTDIEDAHILLWREQANGVYRIRGQFKTRGDAFTRLAKWCKKYAITDSASPTAAAPMLPGEPEAYEAIINGAKTISYHSDDGEYNPDKIKALKKAASDLTVYKTTCQQQLASGVPDPAGKLAATVEYATVYLGYIATIHAHKVVKTKSVEGDFPRYVYTPTQEPPPAQPQPDFTVHLKQATRAAAHRSHKVILGPDGELVLNGTQLINGSWEDWGQPGRMYLITLPTGEEIEFRGDANDTQTPLSSQGLTQLTIPDQSTIAASLQRIDGQLAVMGLKIADADRQDLELYYWRHLNGVMAARADSCKTGKSKATGSPVTRFQEYWKRVTDTAKMSRDDETEMWRHAFAALTSRDELDAFLVADGHLPRFMHMDLRNPDLPCGKPYWERFDVPDSQWRIKQMPSSTYKSGPRWVMATGVAMATEARIRTFAIWKSGMSSTEDMGCGSAGYLFTRNNMETSDSPSVFFSPRTLRRTTNYSFSGDMFGRISERPNSAYFDFDAMTNSTYSSNEMLIKDAMSLLDDIEILAFGTAASRDAAIAELAALGITEIRAVPVATRFIVRGDTGALAKARAAVRKTYTNGLAS